MLSSSLFLASLWSSWKGLVISISSKCDIPPLPFWTPALATLSLFKKRLFCVHVTTTHAAVPATMVANRLWLITALQMSHRGRRDVERGALRYFWPLTSAPPETFPLRAYLSPLLWSLDLLNRWNKRLRRSSVTGPTLLPCWPGVKSRLFWFVSYTQTFIYKHSVWVERPLLARPRCPVSYDKCYYAPFPVTLPHAARVYHRVFLEHKPFGHHPVFEQL